jgi:hypothetical protein
MTILYKLLVVALGFATLGFITMGTLNSRRPQACPGSSASTNVVCAPPPSCKESRDAPCPLCELPPFKDAFKHLDWDRMKVDSASAASPSMSSTWPLGTRSAPSTTRILICCLRETTQKAERDRDGMYSGHSLEEYLHVLARYLAPKLPAPRVVHRPTPLAVVSGSAIP